MSDYISREAVLIQLCNRHCATDPAVCLFKITHIGEPGCFTVDHILEIPAADVRPVVYCKDCVWYKESKVLAPNRFCYRLEDTNGNHIGYNCAPYDFCSYGKRREGGTP